MPWSLFSVMLCFTRYRNGSVDLLVTQEVNVLITEA